MNGRLYDPVIGRFLQADPIIQAPHNAQSHNRYSYVLNRVIDPKSAFLPNSDPPRHSRQGGSEVGDALQPSPGGKSAPSVVDSHVSKSFFIISSFLRARSSAALPSNRRSGGASDRAASMIA